MNSLTSTRRFTVTIITLLSLLGYGYFVFAAPVGGYEPGVELDPDCAPGEINCFVKSLLTTADNGLTVSGSNIQLGGLLTDQTMIETGSNLFAIVNDSSAGFDTTGFLISEFSGFPGTSFARITGGSTIADGNIEMGVVSYGVGVAGRMIYTNNTTGLESGVNIGAGYTQIHAQNGSGSYFASFDMQSASIGYQGTGWDNDQMNGILISNQGVTARGSDPSSGYNMIWAVYDPMSGNDVRENAFLYNNGVWQWHAYDSSRDDSLATSPINFLYTDSAGYLMSAPISLLGGGGSGWSLSGDAGTTAGTNFIGTTDAQDFIIKTNSVTAARFGQIGDVELGQDYLGFFLKSTSTNIGTMSWGWGGVASGELATVLGLNNIADGDISMVWGESNNATGNKSTAFGYENDVSGYMATVFGRRNNASGELATAFGRENFARSYAETTFGYFGTDYTPTAATSANMADRLLSIGNGDSSTAHNAYTLFKDGSFAYNDDNFQNDNPGTEQNMFYFNYGNHDGLGAVQTKRAVRLGSALSGEWDVDNIFVGDRSVAIGFAAGPSLNGPIARGAYSIALGTDTVASGTMSTAFGVRTDATGSEATAFGNSNMASGDNSTAFGPAGAIASGLGSIAFGNNAVASGRYTIAFGGLITARSYSEIAYGIQNTLYTPASTTLINGADRLVVIGNGNVIPGDPNEFSDAFTILKSGQTGIGIDNFEANTNGNIFQVGDGSTNIIGYVDDTTGNWVAVSDEHKKDNITDLSYGLNELIQLRPTSFNYKRNGEHTIGFIAQQVLPIVPEAVYGTESEGYGMSYATLTPVIVKAIQEMNLNITQLSDMTRENTWRDSLIEWFGTATNGITKLFAGEVHTNTLCVGQTCVTESQLQQLLQNQNITYTIPTPTDITEETDNTDPVADPVNTTDLVDTGDSNQEIPAEEPVVDISDNLETSAPVLDTPTE